MGLGLSPYFYFFFISLCTSPSLRLSAVGHAMNYPAMGFRAVNRLKSWSSDDDPVKVKEIKNGEK
jgi:hypothetical protein